jgi:hypothetical protein
MRHFLKSLAGILLLIFTLRSLLAIEPPILGLPDSGTVELIGTVEKVIGPTGFIVRKGSGTVYVYRVIHVGRMIEGEAKPILRGMTVRVVGSVQYRLFGHSLYGDDKIVEYEPLNCFLMRLRTKHIRGESVQIMN